MVDNGSSLCHHVIHDGRSVCVVVFNGATYYMPDDVATDFDSVVGESPEASVPTATSQFVLPATINLDVRGADRRDVNSACHSYSCWLQMPCHEKTEANGKRDTVCKASTSHVMLAWHAITLAVVQCVQKKDFSDFDQCAVDNASSITPLGAHIVRNFFVRGARNVPGPDTPPITSRDSAVEIDEWIVDNTFLEDRIDPEHPGFDRVIF